MYDLIIIGGGPAGTSAGVYSARKRLKTLLITKEFGGQSNVSPDIHNWIGTPSISGEDLGKAFKAHLGEYTSDCLEIKEGVDVSSIQKEEFFTVTSEGGESFSSRTVLIATGSTRRKLLVPGAEKFENKGITYCASCDGPIFSGQDVAVIGGGNAGFETAAQLLEYAKSVTLLQHRDAYKADAITVEAVLKHPNMTGLLNAELKEVSGDKFVSSVVYKDKKTGEEHALEVGGVFAEIGLIPSTQMLKNFVDLTDYGQIIIDERTGRSSLAGLWAAGDCTNGLYHQNNIAAGDAVKALEDVYLALRAGK